MAGDWRTLRRLGSTELLVTGICVGGSPLGNIPRSVDYDAGNDRGVATVLSTLASPINFLDTSNGYGRGESERRIGAAIRRVGELPEGFVLATKVDADPATKDFSAARVRKSVEESFERLGIDKCRLMYLHDPEYNVGFEGAMAPGGAVEGLLELQKQGVVEAIGIAAGPIPMMRQFVQTGHFQAVLSHNRYTLLDRSAEPLIADALARGMAYVNAAPYGGGMLAKGPQTHKTYAYKPASAEVVEAALAMERACEARGVPLAAAALQFSLRDPRVTATVVGMSAPERIAETVALADHPIPVELWEELEALAPSSHFWIN
jgi:D-threo-aldose 1-dehydrogenase